MTTLLGTLKDQIAGLLLPLVAASEVKSVSTMPFYTGQDLTELLQKYRSSMPGIFVSLPAVTYTSDADNRIPDARASYQLLIGLVSREEFSGIEQSFYALHERLTAALMYAEITAPQASVLQVELGSCTLVDAENVYALYMEFSLPIKAWEIVDR